jgi:hypothetical protein
MKGTLRGLWLLLLLAAPAEVHAQLEYSTNADGVSLTVTDYDGSGGAVAIPSSFGGLTVTCVGEEAFANSGITSISFANTVTNIGVEAFYGCGGLSSVTIPTNITVIAEGAFAVCVNLKTMSVAANNAFYSSSKGVIFDKSGKTLVECPGGLNATSYTIASTVTNIGEAAFEGCINLTNVTVPASITSIGEYVFADSYNMTGITLPAGLTNIEDHAFYGCNGLESLAIPASVTSIGAEAFYSCYDLASVTIPTNVNSIGPGAFAWCIGLKTITVAGQNSSYSSVNGVLFDKGQATLVQYPAGLGGSYTIPASVTSIGASAFEGCQTLINVTIPSSVTGIGDYAFGYCYDLASAAIPAGITNFGAYAFYGCNDLTNLTIAAGVTNIGAYAFYGCYDLTSVTIPASISSLGEGAFEYCIHLTNVFFQGDAPVADSTVFAHDNSSPTAYYLPGTAGWSASFAGLPAVLWNPLIQTGDGGFGVQSNQFGFNITGTANIPIVVAACTNLAAALWTPLQALTLTNGLCYFSEPFQTNSTGRFYRISEP